MRSVVSAFAVTAALLCSATVSQAQQQKSDTTIYCLVQGGDARSYNCSYRTMDACLASRSGAGGSCVPYRISGKKK